ncbi:MAG: NAD(P)/FAD-dependent oxidoreductase [Caulobacteraceae bacterium]|nr:NAD(P)/FAD-dependent oxidoreductase [Caulobacteraceae bacterium]
MDPRRLDAGLTRRTDVLVVGGGPAGTSAAISCALNGLTVVLCERELFPRERVGEALHPGVEGLLDQLGLAGRLGEVTGARFDGAEVDWAGDRRFVPFGSDAAGPWRGFQVRRAAFDALLLERARALGVEVLNPCGALDPIVETGRAAGATTEAGDVRARLLIDASGPARWLERKLGLARRERSPQLVVRYGYVRGRLPDRDLRPLIHGDTDGWTWIACVEPGRYQWVRLDLSETARNRDWRPAGLAGLAPEGPSRGAEMGWRLTTPAGPGWMLAGDAAAMLDPTSSHGVLKALLSGRLAGATAAAMLNGGDEAQGLAAYRQWMEGWFTTDVAALRSLYRRLGAPWAI